MFFYDHAMSRDDFMDQEEKPAGEIDMVDGLRAMSMFKRDSGPLQPTDINQEVKYALVSHPECIVELNMDGFLSESLVRELEQMMKDSSDSMMDMPKMTSPGVIIIAQGNPMGGEMYEVGNPKKKSKSRVNEAGNYTKPGMRKRQFQRIKAGGKGGKPGQWSARKAQMLAQAYKKAGGGYRD